MPQYFLKESLSQGDECRIDGRDFNHLKTVRRLKPGDTVHVRDINGSMFECRAEQIFNDSAVLKIVSRIESSNDLPEVVLAAALLKNKNFELVLQKAAEIGISGIQPIISERTVVQMDRLKDTKSMRWNMILEEASKQSLRADIPFLDDVCIFDDMILKYDGYERLIAVVDSSVPSVVAAVKSSVNEKYVLAIGPEGGFSPEETEKAKKAGWKCVHYGFTQMRAETASIVISSLIINEILEKKIEVL